MNFVTILGLTAGTLTTLAFLPQLIKTWKSKSTSDISLGMFVILCAGILELRNFKSATEIHRKSTEIISVKFCVILWLILLWIVYGFLSNLSQLLLLTLLLLYFVCSFYISK